MAENHRAIPPSDPDYDEIYHLRSDAESRNRAFDDNHFLSRSHSMGIKGQLLDWLGHGLLTNAIALPRFRARGALVARAA